MLRNRHARPRLFAEPLEPRNLLAGNVSAFLSGDNLIINGDNLSNTISVESFGPGTVQVRGFGTSVNGTPNGIKTFPVSGTIQIEMNRGYDVVRVTNLVIQDNLWMSMGAGNDEVLLGKTTAGENARFGGTPSGPLFVQNNVGIYTYGGDDRVFQSDVHVQGAGTINVAEGSDRIQIDRPAGSGENVEYDGLFRIFAGEGQDQLNIHGLVVDDDMVVASGGGGGEDISVNFMDVHGDLTIDTANFTDDIALQNTFVRDVLTIVSLAGYDTINFAGIADRAVVDSGFGNDKVHINSANINVLTAVLADGFDELDLLNITTDEIFGYGGDGDDLFLVRTTRAIDALFDGNAGTDTYQDSVLMPNNINDLELISIERRQTV